MTTLEKARLSVVLDDSNLRRASSGRIVGPFFLRVGAVAFPDDGWTDFVDVVLTWWLHECMRALDGVDSIRLRFMDGDFECRLVRAGEPDIYLITFVGGDRVVGTFDVTTTALHLGSELADASARLLTACRVNRWIGREIETLQESLAAMRRKIGHPSR